MISSHIERGDISGIKSTLKGGIDLSEDIETPFGYMPPLLYACRMAHAFTGKKDAAKAIELMIDHGADPHVVCEDLGNCFNMIYHSDTLIKEPTARLLTELLLSKKVAIEDSSVSDIFRYPPAIALAKQYFTCVELFVEYGCDLTPRKLGIKESLSDFLAKNYPEIRPTILSAMICREMNHELKPTQFKESKKMRL